MDIKLRADKYAEGKAIAAFNDAIAKAYFDGYHDGYKDREAEIPADLTKEKTDYVDLGLPSGTLWANDYEKDDEGNILYLPYVEAKKYKLPTVEQWKELVSNCRWSFDTDKAWDGKEWVEDAVLVSAHCIGPNGQLIELKASGYRKVAQIVETDRVCFWLNNNTDETEGGSSIGTFKKYFYQPVSTDENNIIAKFFTGYSIPIRLVR